MKSTFLALAFMAISAIAAPIAESAPVPVTANVGIFGIPNDGTDDQIGSRLGSRRPKLYHSL